MYSHNRLNMNRIPCSLPRSTYSTCRFFRLRLHTTAQPQGWGLTLHVESDSELYLLAGGFPLCCPPPPFGVSPCGCVGAGPPSGSLSRVALAFMGSHAAPSGGSASDDWATQGRTRGKARGSARAGAPADSQHALHHGSGTIYCKG